METGNMEHQITFRCKDLLKQLGREETQEVEE